jgi:asparagine synthase (glutamine-hydrolysing)
MCGIVGFTGPPRPAVLRAMCASIRHRGPDDEGFHESNDASLAMRRLAIVDLTSGHQPMSNEDETVWVVFNGEIYNHHELRRDLTRQGHRFRTSHSDTETVVHAFEQHGFPWPESVQANGMFGLALWETRQRRLHLYRDRMGKKPLYYAQIGKNLAFASEIKALLLHPEVSRDLDPASIAQYFSLKNISAPATAYRQIRQLPPGCCLIWQDGRMDIRPWQRPDFSPLSDITEDEAAAEIRRLLEDAVRLRMDCDAPYGAYLSGGLDSSSVAALMARFQQKPLKTFCLGYDEDQTGQFSGKAQDIHYSKEMSRRLGSEHYECILTAEDFAQSMPDVIRSFDEPFSGTVSTFFLSILMHRHVKVALSGDGADELFGSYLAHRLARPMQFFLSLESSHKAAYESLDERAKAGLAPFNTADGFQFLSRIAHERQSVWRDRLAVFPRSERDRLLTPDFLSAAGPVTDPYEVLESGLSATDPLNQVLEVDQKELLANQVLPFVDRLSMAHSIEVRCPFLDHRLVSFVNRLPGSFKIDGARTKSVLRRALTGLLPPEIIHRPKEGFVQPIYTWMHGALHDWVVGWLSELPSELFQADALDSIKSAFSDKQGQKNAQYWNLVCFSIWWSSVRK